MNFRAQRIGHESKRLAAYFFVRMPKNFWTNELKIGLIKRVRLGSPLALAERLS